MNDNRWKGHYTAKYDPDTGKRIVKNVLGKIQAEAKEKLPITLQEAENLNLIREGGCTVAKWINTWFETYSKQNICPFAEDYYR